MKSLNCLKCGKPLTPRQILNHRKYCSIACCNKHKFQVRKERLTTAKQVWACGGGVESTTIAALIVQGKLPKPDLAYITDCGWERSSTWEHVNNFLIPELDKVNVRLQIIKTVDYTENDIIDRNGWIRIPLFVKKNGKIGKARSFCNRKWKAQVANKWLKKQGVERCETWFGINCDDKSRVRKSQYWWNQNKYPLVEQEINREECIWILGQMGWPKPLRTSCFICPSQSNADWINIKENYPEDWARACEVERYIREIDSNMYLHKACVPLDQVKF